MVVNIFVKFGNISHSLQVTKRTCVYDQITIYSVYTVQRVITLKVGKPQLWFLFFARHLMVHNISVVS